MSLDLDTYAGHPCRSNCSTPESNLTLGLQDFVGEFGDELLGNALSQRQSAGLYPQPTANAPANSSVASHSSAKLFSRAGDRPRCCRTADRQYGEHAAIVNSGRVTGRRPSASPRHVLNAQSYCHLPPLWWLHLVYKVALPRSGDGSRRQSCGFSAGQIRSSIIKLRERLVSIRVRSSSSWAALRMRMKHLEVFHHTQRTRHGDVAWR